MSLTVTPASTISTTRHLYAVAFYYRNISRARLRHASAGRWPGRKQGREDIERECVTETGTIAAGAGGLLGTLRAGQKKDLDIVGVFFVAFAVGFGGGVIRDLLLGSLPPASFENPWYITVVGVAAVHQGRPC